MTRETDNGVAYDPAALDRVEQRFWADIWGSVPEGAAEQHGLVIRRFGSLQASLVAELAAVPMLNLVLGAAADAEERDRNLAAAVEWVRSQGVRPYVPVTPGLPGSEASEVWLRANGFEPGHAWMKFVRDAHEPRFAPPAVEVVELSDPAQAPFGMIAAAAFELPAWGAVFFSELPGRPGWRCYAAIVDGEAQACGAMLIEDGIAEFGVGATLAGARGRGCQLALLHRRIRDAAAAGCHTLFVETGERVPERPAVSYRNILRAGFEEAYLRPSWRLPSDRR